MVQVDSHTELPVRARPSWYVRLIMVSFRTVLLTLLFAGLGMGVGLFVGIVGTIAVAAAHHVSPDMTHAYRYYAIPTGVVLGAGAFLWNVIGAVREAIKTRGR